MRNLPDTLPKLPRKRNSAKHICTGMHAKQQPYLIDTTANFKSYRFLGCTYCLEISRWFDLTPANIIILLFCSLSLWSDNAYWHCCGLHKSLPSLSIFTLFEVIAKLPPTHFLVSSAHAVCYWMTSFLYILPLSLEIAAFQCFLLYAWCGQSSSTSSFLLCLLGWVGSQSSPTPSCWFFYPSRIPREVFCSTTVQRPQSFCCHFLLVPMTHSCTEHN